MTMPHVELGNTASDLGQGANSFAAGLLAQRQRQQQIALQEALGQSKIALDTQQGQHLQAQTPLIGAQTTDAAAQAAQREQEGLPADETDEERFRQVEPKAHPGIFAGMNKAEANKYIQTIAQANAMKLRLNMVQDRFEQHGQVVPTPDGGFGIVRPNQPGGGTPTMLPTGPNGGFGKPTSGAERSFAGAGQAAASAHSDLKDFEHAYPNALNEIAGAISLPNFGHLIPGIGPNVSRVLQAFRLQGASPEAQMYLKRMFDFAGIVGPKRYGLRGMQNEVTLQQLWTDFGAGQFGLTPEGIAAAQRNRENAVHQLEQSAGPNAWDQSQQVFPQNQPGLLTPSQPTPGINPRFDPRANRGNQ